MFVSTRNSSSTPANIPQVGFFLHAGKIWGKEARGACSYFVQRIWKYFAGVIYLEDFRTVRKPGSSSAFCNSRKSLFQHHILCNSNAIILICLLNLCNLKEYKLIATFFETDVFKVFHSFAKYAYILPRCTVSWPFGERDDTLELFPVFFPMPSKIHLSLHGWFLHGYVAVQFQKVVYVCQWGFNSSLLWNWIKWTGLKMIGVFPPPPIPSKCMEQAFWILQML